MKPIPLSIDWSAQTLLKNKLTSLEQDWLFDSSSLTQRLMLLSDNQFSVEVLEESWQLVREDECEKLGISSDKLCWVREVLLYGTNEPWVYARSVALETGLNHNQYNLSNLGNRPLGAVLFSDDSFKRSPLEATHYPMSLLPINQQFSGLWGRRSSFINNQINVLVQEVFLPDFWQQAKRNN